MKQASNEIVYDTEKATLLGRNRPGLGGRSRSLYRTAEGAFFLYQVTDSKIHDVAYAVFNDPGTGWFTAKRNPKITPLSVEDAIQEYNRLKERYLDFADAFPDTDVTEA